MGIKEDVEKQRQDLQIGEKPVPYKETPQVKSLEEIEPILLRCATLLSKQISMLEKRGELKALTAGDSLSLNRSINTLLSLRIKKKEEPLPPLPQPEKPEPEDEEVEDEYLAQLSSMSKKDLLKALLPLLDDAGVDTKNLRFKKEGSDEKDKSEAR